jgi:hypothetical protein
MTILNDDNAVEVAERGKAVRHRDHGTVVHEMHQSALDLHLGLGIKRRGGLVEHDDRGLLQKGPPKADALALPA